MSELERLEAFIAVVRAGGFSAAARSLGQPVATVSRKLSLLEQSLGVRLLTRSTRHVALTEAGQGYYEDCTRLLEALREANARVRDEHRAPQGQLLVSAPVGFGHLHLQPVVHEFLAAYPSVDVDLRLADQIVDLFADNIDCAVRISELKDSSLIARRLGSIRMVVCAAPSYLARAGVPRDPAELLQHQCVSWTSLGPYKAWDFQLEPGSEAAERRVPIHVRFATSTPQSAIAAAIAGVGLVQATSYQLAEAVATGALVPVLREFETAAVPVSLVYASKRLLPAKQRAFLDFAAPRLSERLQAVAAVLS